MSVLFLFVSVPFIISALLSTAFFTSFVLKSGILDFIGIKLMALGSLVINSSIAFALLG